MTLLPESRRNRLLAEATKHGVVRVAELSAALGVTPITIRRDLNALVSEGLLRRVHGGAALPEVSPSATGTIGMLVPSLDDYWPDIVHGAQTEARARGLGLIIRGTTYDATDDRDKIKRLLDQTGADGLILAPAMGLTQTSETLEWLVNAGIGVVLVEREAPWLDGSAISSVATDHAYGAALAARHLGEHGHRRVGLVIGTSPHANRLRSGWRHACDRLGIEHTEYTLGEHTIGGIVDDCIATSTTGLMVNADADAVDLVRQCERQGIAVPEAMSVIAYNDEIAELATPPLTAVRPPRQTLGREAIAMLARQFADASRPAERLVLSPRLIARQSVASPLA